MDILIRHNCGERKKTVGRRWSIVYLLPALLPICKLFDLSGLIQRFWFSDETLRVLNDLPKQFVLH